MSPLLCPVCAEEFSINVGKSRGITDNLRHHMQRAHSMSSSEVDELLLQRGIIRPRLVIDDDTIAQWNKMVADGVIE